MNHKPILETMFDNLKTSVYPTNRGLGISAAKEAIIIIRDAVNKNGEANVILATGNSQLSFLRALRTMSLEWSKVNFFHMDEYVGLDPAHPASFPLFLKRHFLDYIRPKTFFPIPPSNQNNAEKICNDYAGLLARYPADLCVLGIGENGHLAFNDPPYADFADPRRVKIVRLDGASRRQQVGEGHFKHIDEVPTHAITLTIPALLSAKRILALVPETRKAEAIRRSLMEPVSEACPGSILRRVPHAHLYLDVFSATKILPENPGS